MRMGIVGVARVFAVLSYVSMLVMGKFTGWIDPDTKEEHKKLKNLKNGIEYDLVMSDEFEKEGRLFADGEDPMWCAIEKSDDDQTAQGKKSLQVSPNLFLLPYSMFCCFSNRSH